MKNLPQLVPTVLPSGPRCKEVTDLAPADLRLVVALISAKRAGKPGCTREELAAITGMHRTSNMTLLERELWVVSIGRAPGKGNQEQLWAPHPRATLRLGLNGWVVLLFTAEELPRVDANLPEFLEPLPGPTVSLNGPGVIDATGEAVEDERATA